MAACALPAWSDATGLRWRSKYRKAEEGKAVTRVVGAADRLQVQHMLLAQSRVVHPRIRRLSARLLCVVRQTNSGLTGGKGRCRDCSKRTWRCAPRMRLSR